MNSKIIISLILFLQTITMCHEQNMHQYIVREAWKLLLKSYPQLQNNEIANYIGISETNGYQNLKSMSDGLMVSGAWIEDEYDIVYHYGIRHEPAFNQSVVPEVADFFSIDDEAKRIAYTSITHFWDADAGDEFKTKSENPNYYATITLGGIEFYSFSIGKYIVPELAIAVKWSMFGVRSSMDASASIGFGMNYFFKKLLIFKYVSADYLIMYGGGFKGNGFEVVTGNCTNMEKGFGFVYEVGIGYSDVKAQFSFPQYKRLILFDPIIKIGLNYNF